MTITIHKAIKITFPDEHHLIKILPCRYHHTPAIKIADSSRDYHCYVCRKRILSKRQYYDGGYGYRAHLACILTKEELNGKVSKSVALP